MCHCQPTPTPVRTQPSGPGFVECALVVTLISIIALTLFTALVR